MPPSLVPRRGKLGGSQGGAAGLRGVGALVCAGAFGLALLCVLSAMECLGST